jgi:gas vesicle protein GvpA/GvpJ/GvpM family
VSTGRTLYSAGRGPGRDITLLDLLDRLLEGGVVIRGQIRLAAADIDLVELELALLVASIDKVAGPR